MEIALPGPQTVVIGSKHTDSVAARLSAADISGNARAETIFGTLLDAPHPGVVVYLLTPGALLPLGIPAGMIDDFTLLIIGDFSEDALHADLLFNFETKARARVAGLVLRTVVLAGSRKEKDRMFADARVTVDSLTVTLSPVVIEAALVLEYLDILLKKEGGYK